MKRVAFLITLLLLTITASFSQKKISDNDKFASLCKVWGFLKYYHPEVAKGKLDWDEALISHVDSLSQIDTKEQLSDFYIKWINSLGSVAVCKSCKTDFPDSVKRNLDFGWMDDNTLFTDSLSKTLHYILQNRNQKNNYYVKYGRVGNADFSNEKEFAGLAYPAYEFRLLTLFRYWNIINYFYPYKYVIGENWGTALNEMIPVFKGAPDTIAYHLAMLQMVRRLNDTHAFFTTKYTNDYNGNYWTPAELRAVNDTVVVRGYYNYQSAPKNELAKGDRILEVDGKPISVLLKEKLAITTGSSEAVKLRNVVLYLLRGKTDSVKIKYERNRMVETKTFHRALLKVIKIDTSIAKNNTWKQLDNNVGYINLRFLKPEQVDEVMEKFAGTKAIIIDNRSYPYVVHKLIANYLNPHPSTFAKFTGPDLSYPGMLRPIAPVKCGSENDKYYKGKIILLLNEQTQSYGEFTSMALQTAPNVTTIGSQTAGADGDVVKIVLPGRYTTFMSGLGVYYPDGRETQRVGVAINIVVKPTAKGLMEGKDEVLDRAIELANRDK